VNSTWIIEDVRIDRLVEDAGPYNDRRVALRGVSDEQVDAERDWLVPDAVDATGERLILSFHSYVVRTPNSCVLVDTCIGDDKTLAFRPSWHRKTGARWVRGLGALGIEPGDVDIVINTHLHLDHVGWNTRWTGASWVPTFPRARYIIVESEYRCALQRGDEAGGPLAELHATSLRESVEPVIRAGQADLVMPDHVVDDYVRLIPTPGHTVGHVSVAVGRGHDVAVFTGDLLHSPLQAVHPDAAWTGEERPDISESVRRAFLERYVDTPTLVCTAHFAAPSAGRLRRWRGGYRLETIQPSSTTWRQS
jgi:glyoxylase-like metal-dependent hydrolase (beta-lactamase superfamily II)